MEALCTCDSMKEAEVRNTVPEDANWHFDVPVVKLGRPGLQHQNRVILYVHKQMKYYTHDEIIFCCSSYFKLYEHRLYYHYFVTWFVRILLVHNSMEGNTSFRVTRYQVPVLFKAYEVYVTANRSRTRPQGLFLYY